MTERERQENIKKAERDMYFFFLTFPFQVLWIAIKTIVLPFLGLLGLTITAVEAYNSPKKRR